jgi:hypothetical protein
MTEDQPAAPNQRSFTLNSREFHQAVSGPGDRPWIPNGALPRDPRSWSPPVMTEPRRPQPRASLMKH